jgi:hypothetical protein
VRSPPPLTEHHLCWRSVVGGCVPNGGHRTIHSNFLWGRTAASHAASREAPRGTVCRRALKISIWNGPPRLDCSAVRKAWDRQSLPTLRGRLVAARHARGLYKHHSGHAPPCTMIVLDAMWCKVSERKLARSWARGLESVCATEALKAFFYFCTVRLRFEETRASHIKLRAALVGSKSQHSMEVFNGRRAAGAKKR